MKAFINENYYPILDIEADAEGDWEIPGELYERYKLAELEYDAVQDELAEIYQQGSK